MTDDREPPPLHNVGVDNLCGDIEQRIKPHQVPTASHFGAPNDVVHWSIPPDIYVLCPYCARGMGPIGM